MVNGKKLEVRGEYLTQNNIIPVAFFKLCIYYRGDNNKIKLVLQSCEDFDSEVFKSYSSFQSHLIEADRSRWFKILNEAIKLKTNWNFEGRLISSAKGEIWINITGKIVYSEADKIVFQCAIFNICKSKEIEDELRHSKKQLELAIHGSGIGTWDWRIQSGKISYNERWAEIIGYKLEELGTPDIDTRLMFCHPEDLINSWQQLEEHFYGRTEYYECVVRMMHKNGKWMWVLDRGKIVEWDDQGLPLRMTGIHIDVSEKKNYVDSLITVNETKDRLIASIVHDLKNPLNAINSLVDFIRIENKESERTEEYLSHIKSSAANALHVIAELLELATLEAANHHLEFSATRPEKIIDEVIDIFKYEAARKNVQLIAEVENGLSEVFLIEDKFKHALENLISNALKFTPALGKISVGAGLDNDSYIFYVKDNGIGIPPDYQLILFDKFTKAKRRGLHGEASTGLGMSIVKQIVELHGGSIEVESFEKLGSTFKIKLPNKS